MKKELCVKLIIYKD